MKLKDLSIFRNALHYLVILILCASCTPKDNPPPVGGIDDFRPPEGRGDGVVSLNSIFNLNADVAPGRVELSWVVPASYRSGDYKIHIFRSQGSSSFNVPDPWLMSSVLEPFIVSQFYEPSAISEYVDRNLPNEFNIAPNTEYTYHLFIEIDNEWSSAEKITVVTPPQIFAQNIPQGFSFWELFSNTFGIPNPGGGLTPSTITAMPDNEFGSDIAFAENSAIMYVSDPQENRIIIYLNESILSCAPFQPGSEDYDICMAMANYDAYLPYGVLGQRNFQESYSCQDTASLPNNECLTRPTGLEVYNNRLIISDSGNNRIVMRPATLTGCYNVLEMTGESTQRECEWTRLIGQKGFDDIEVFDVSTNGNSSLNNPLGIKVHGADLYIADSENHRVVKACRFLDETAFSCTDEGNWQTSMCSFCRVLGQVDLFSVETFEQLYMSGDLAYSPVQEEIISPSSTIDRPQTFLDRSFKPINISIYEGDFVIHSRDNFFVNEGGYSLELRDRLMFFPLESLALDFPICREDTFDNTENCEARISLGNYNSTPNVLMGGESYSDLAHTFTNASFMVLNEEIVMGSVNNHLFFLNDYENNKIPNVMIPEPEGAFSSELGRNLPNFEFMDRIHMNGVSGQIMIFDKQRGQIHAFSTIDLVDTN